jgi:hypothetical protein
VHNWGINWNSSSISIGIVSPPVSVPLRDSRPEISLNGFQKYHWPVSQTNQPTALSVLPYHTNSNADKYRKILTYILTPWSRVLLEKLTNKLCS